MHARMYTYMLTHGSALDDIELGFKLRRKPINEVMIPEAVKIIVW